MSRKPLTSCWLFWVLSLLPLQALAHSPVKGIDNFYNGVLHPLFVPAHVILLIALGLFLGQQGMQQIQLKLMAFLASVITGLSIAWFTTGLLIENYILALAMTVGILIAIAPRLPVAVVVAIAIACGLSLGLDSAQDNLVGKGKFVGLFGSGLSIYFLSLYPLAFSESINKKQWMKIGIRVIGSWVAASALLVLALSLKAGNSEVVM